MTANNYLKTPVGIDDNGAQDNEDIMKQGPLCSTKDDMENQDNIKQAAKRMCAHLEASGVHVKHSAMLEALAHGFGLANWRTLKAVVNQPKGSLPLVRVPNGQAQEWRVEALYTDDNQPFTAQVPARTALEAAYFVIMERLTVVGLDVAIHTVSGVSSDSGLRPRSIHEYRLYGDGTALRALLQEALQLQGLRSTDDCLVSWLQTVLNEGPPGYEFEELTDYVQLQCTYEPLTIWPGDTRKPSQALVELCDLVEAAHGGIVALEQDNEQLACTLHQVRSMCKCFGANIDNPTFGWTLDAAPGAEDLPSTLGC